MRNFWMAALSIALVCSFAGVAGAKVPKEPKAPKKTAVEIRFEKLDANHDGQVSLDEFCMSKDGKPLENKAKDAAEKMFKRYDTDSSGQLTLEELKLAGRKPKTPK